MTSVYLRLDRPIVVVMNHLPFGLHYKLKAYSMEAREQFKFIADLTERGNFALWEIGLRLVAAPAVVRAQTCSTCPLSLVVLAHPHAEHHLSSGLNT